MWCLALLAMLNISCSRLLPCEVSTVCASQSIYVDMLARGASTNVLPAETWVA